MDDHTLQSVIVSGRFPCVGNHPSPSAFNGEKFSGTFRHPGESSGAPMHPCAPIDQLPHSAVESGTESSQPSYTA